MLFNLLFLVAFAVPYVAKTLTWTGVNHSQELMRSTTDQLREVADQLRQEAHPSVTLMGNVIERVSTLEPCLSEECEEWQVWEVLIGKDKSPQYWVLAVTLLVFNLLRAGMTWIVTPLRDEEERSGWSPAAKPYAWLIWPHRVVLGLGALAIVSFAVHGYHWLTLPVWLPK